MGHEQSRDYPAAAGVANRAQCTVSSGEQHHNCTQHKTMRGLLARHNLASFMVEKRNGRALTKKANNHTRQTHGWAPSTRAFEQLCELAAPDSGHTTF